MIFPAFGLVFGGGIEFRAVCAMSQFAELHNMPELPLLRFLRLCIMIYWFRFLLLWTKHSNKQTNNYIFPKLLRQTPPLQAYILKAKKFAG